VDRFEYVTVRCNKNFPNSNCARLKAKSIYRIFISKMHLIQKRFKWNVTFQVITNEWFR